MLYSPEEDYEECARLSLQFFSLQWSINLPPWLFPGAKVIRKYTISSENSEYQELVQRAYGFWYSCEDYYLNVKYGIQDEEANLWGESSNCRSWSCFIPWLNWTHVRETIYGPDWSFFADLTEVNWKERERLVESCPKISFQVRDYDGEIIHATGYLEEMEWHRGTSQFRWVRHFCKPKIRRSIDIRYATEIGRRKEDSWKGGTLGHGIDVEPGESIANSLDRLYTTHSTYADATFLRETLESALLPNSQGE